MLWEDWLANFTHLFVGLAFPSDHTPLYQSRTALNNPSPTPNAPPPSWFRLVVSSAWDQDAGGNRLMQTAANNPKLHIKVGGVVGAGGERGSECGRGVPPSLEGGVRRLIGACVLHGLPACL